ncbi:unnamed protein product [Sympodiomycopsis kandeliae]
MEMKGTLLPEKALASLASTAVLSSANIKLPVNLRKEPSFSALKHAHQSTNQSNNLFILIVKMITFVPMLVLLTLDFLLMVPTVNSSNILSDSESFQDFHPREEVNPALATLYTDDKCAEGAGDLKLSDFKSHRVGQHCFNTRPGFKSVKFYVEGNLYTAASCGGTLQEGSSACHSFDQEPDIKSLSFPNH